MLVVSQQAALFRPIRRVSTWLLGIAGTSPTRLGTCDNRRPPSQKRIAARTIPSTCYVSGNARAVASLPPEPRIGVERTYYHASSAREIAQRLEEAASTVRGRLRLARRRLAQRLSQQGLGPIELTCTANG
jgi:hypothetical protein